MPIAKEPTNAIGDLAYRSFSDRNLGAVNSGAGFFVSSIGTSATEINKDVRI